MLGGIGSNLSLSTSYLLLDTHFVDIHLGIMSSLYHVYASWDAIESNGPICNLWYVCTSIRGNDFNPYRLLCRVEV